MKTLEGPQKISNFSLHRFSWYSTPNMALQKIILTSFFVFFSSSRSRAMRSSRHNSSKILSNRNEILQTCSGVNIIVTNTFGFIRSRGFGVSGPQSDKIIWNFPHAILGRILKYWDFFMNYILLSRNGSTKARNFTLSWLEWQTRMVDPTCKIIFL